MAHSISSDAAEQSCAEFLALTHPIDTQRWQLALTAKVSGGRGSLFGGAGLAAGIVALEHATNKPVIWATGQYLSLTQLDERLDLEVILPAIGRNVVQGRVVGHVGDREVITVIGAAGSRPSAAEGCWETYPNPPPPEDCPLVPHGHGNESLHEHIELRLARGFFGFSGFGTPTEDGRSLLWVRMPEVVHDAGALAIIADYMPSVLGNAMGRIMHCTSLDNTIRFGRLEPTRWVLCDNRMEYAGNGFGHGTVHLWSEAGTLLATASQSMIVREPGPSPG
jgi:acyl-CoA thioesterase-2